MAFLLAVTSADVPVFAGENIEDAGTEADTPEMDADNETGNGAVTPENGTGSTTEAGTDAGNANTDPAQADPAADTAQDDAAQDSDSATSDPAAPEADADPDASEAEDSDSAAPEADAQAGPAAEDGSDSAAPEADAQADPAAEDSGDTAPDPAAPGPAASFEEEQFEDTIVVDMQTGYEHFDGDNKVSPVDWDAAGIEDPLTAGAPLPAAYKTVSLPALRDQNPYGSCWAFTSMSLAEISRMKSGVAAPDYSELALCYFTYKTVEDPLGGTAGDWNKCKTSTFLDIGGNLNFAGPVLANWVGASDETLAPYTDDGIKKALNNGLDSWIAYNDRAHLTGYYKADIKNDRETVKRLIYEHGAVGASMYAYTTLPNYSYSSKYNSYYVKSKTQSNHAVTIVGWDDSFPKENFTSTAEGDGAWLVRNSWWSKGVAEESYFGYFWLSYYDGGLSADAHAFQFAGADNYKHNYQYDGAMHTITWSSYGQIEGANVFEAKACDKGEEIKAASFYTANTNVKYTVQLYTGLTDDADPTSGALWDSVTGTTTCEGYYTVPFNNPVTVAKGTKFAIVVTLEKPDELVSMGYECAMPYASWYQTCTKALEGQSFLMSGGAWNDFGKQTNANLRIKAFTDDSDGSIPTAPYVVIAGVNEVTYGASADFRVEARPLDIDTSTAQWTSSDPEIASVDNTGKLTVHKVGEITLHVKIGELEADHIVKCVPRAPANVGYSKTDEKTVTLAWENVPEADYYIIVGPGGNELAKIENTGLASYSYTDHSMEGKPDLWVRYEIVSYAENGSHVMKKSGIIEFYIGPQKGIIYEVGEGQNNPNNKNKCEGETVILYDATPPAGYTFGGWYTEASFENRVSMISGSAIEDFIRVYARYIPNTYSIRYRSNYGRGNQETMLTSNPIKYDMEETLLTAEEVFQPKAGYTFLNWNTSEDGSGTVYMGGEKVIKLTPENGACIDLFAQWNFESEVYEVTFDACGGNVHPASKLVKSGTKYGTLPVPEKEGLVFEGWYLSRKYLSEERITENTIAELTENCSIYARYKETAGGVLFKVDLTADNKVVPDTKLYLSTKLRGTKIYYTLDGSVPVVPADGGAPAGSTKFYDDAIVMSEDLADSSHIIMVKAVAVKQGCIDGTVSAGTFELLDESKNWGDLSKEVAEQEEITSVEKIPKGFWLTGVKDAVPYTGSACTFKELGVYFGKNKLREKKDYTVKYANNKNAGTAKITISGKGNYSGKTEKTFEIVQPDLKNAIADDILLQYNGKAQKGKPVVVYDTGEKTITLKAGKDFTYQDSAYTEVGEYDITLKGAGNFTGELKAKVKVTNSRLMSKLSYTVKGTSFAQGDEPSEILVKDGGVELKLAKVQKEALKPELLMAMGSTGCDAVYYLENNTQAGNASIVFVGTDHEKNGEPGYAGTVRKTYKISGLPIGGCSFSMPDESLLVYTGSPIEPELGVLSADGKPLKLNVDYTVSCTNNTKAGKAKTVVRGIGRYKGTKTISFKIKPCDISSATSGVFVGYIPDAPYTKNFTKPDVMVKRFKTDGTIEDLVEGRDYKIVCKNNKTANTIASAVIQGIGSYTGAVARNFVIVQGNLANVEWTSKDVVYQMKGGLYKKAAITLIDKNRVKLKAGKDYKIVEYQYACDTQGVKVKDPGTGLYAVDYTKGRRGAVVEPGDILPVGAEVKAVLASCNSNYEGTAEVVFRVVKNDIAKAKVTVVPKQEYMPGRKKEPARAEIEVRFGKEDPLPKTEYEIVEYQNNAVKGTGKVTVRGIDQYGGTKTVSFKISAKPFTKLEK